MQVRLSIVHPRLKSNAINVESKDFAFNEGRLPQRNVVIGYQPA